MIKEISIASGRKKFSIVVSNPLTKNDKELMGDILNSLWIWEAL
ncbi:Uncharacterized protein dnl_47400 [Desulfonema limicola]|uniref:Uncharacterized protein n=2 Tax=Desulfonema limicola TaxID=45656 RepID=A0A975GIH8_9BACT|nr:Uncharacterized protein dnl_47400 [Desulfonema limicola]